MTIKNFTELNAWKEAYELILLIYKFTDNFPQKETYALVSQMRRASVSVASNIAEGFSRRTRKEKIQFYSMAQGSLTELQNQIIISMGVGYLKMAEKDELLTQTTIVHKHINGLIKGTLKIHNT
jgi:four helix bundle protein